MCIRDGVITIQMYSSTITLNMHEFEYEYSENKCTRVRLLYNVLECEYDYFTMYRSTITLDYHHDYFNEYLVSNIKATFMESLGVILFLLLSHFLVF